MLRVNLQSRNEKRGGRVDRQQWPKYGAQVFLGGEGGHRLGESSKGYAEKFLHNLVADNSPAKLQSLADQLACAPGFFGGRQVEGINEDVGVEEELTAHSSHPA